MKTDTFKLDDNNPYVTLTTYILSHSPQVQNGSPRPMVIICPGGAYAYCSDREAEPIALTFNAMGYHAAVLRYSTKNGTREYAHANPPISVTDEPLFPSSMLEIAKTFEIIHQHAKEWHVDTDKIGLCGFSAGGHNAAMYGNHWSESLIQNATSLRGETLKPAWIILSYGLLNPLGYLTGPTPQLDNPEMIRELLEAAFGTTDYNDEDVRHFSPVFHVNEKTPPTFLWATSEDKVVPVQDSLLMATALANASVPFEIHVFEKGPHGLSTASPASANLAYQVDPVAHQWLRLVETWLARLNYPQYEDRAVL